MQGLADGCRSDGGCRRFSLNACFRVEGCRRFGNGLRRDGVVAPYQRDGMAAEQIGKARKLRLGGCERICVRPDDGGRLDAPPFVRYFGVCGVRAVGDAVDDRADLFAVTIVDMFGSMNDVTSLNAYKSEAPLSNI